MEGVSVFRYLMCGAKGAWCKARSPESTRPLFLCFLYFPLLSSVFFALLASFVCPCPSRMRSPCGALSSCSWRHSSASLPFRKAVRSDCRYTEAALAYRRRDAGLEDGKCAPRWPRARISSRRCMNGPESRTGKIILRCTYLADQFQHALSFVDQSLCIFPTVDCNPRARSRRSSGRRASLEVVGGLFLAWSSVTAGGRRARGKAMRLPVEGGVSEETDTSVGRIGESWRDFSHTKCRREHVVLFYFALRSLRGQPKRM